ESVSDLGDRFVPGDTDERARPFAAVAPHRVEQTVFVIHAAGEVRDLVADEAVGGRMVLRPADALDFPVAGSDLEPAGVRTVHRAGGANDLAGHGLVASLQRVPSPLVGEGQGEGVFNRARAVQVPLLTFPPAGEGYRFG